MRVSLTDISLDDLKPWRRGKVRDVYEASDGRLIIVATDRLSAFDCVLPTGIPDKGGVLTRLSAFWFDKVRHIVRTHYITCEAKRFPEPFRQYAGVLQGRTMLVLRAERVDFECVVRGYLAGSAWAEYRKSGTICGQPVEPGLRESQRLPQPMFTPARKAASGHDENVSFDVMKADLGGDLAERLRRLSAELYSFGAAYCETRGLLLADSKFEFGVLGGEVVLIDELFSPDSSRFWPVEHYAAGRPQPSFDKQFVRDYLDSIGWDRTPPAPPLPPDVVTKTRERYLEAAHRICGPAEV
ncbi:MAG: phosphoribosylaminoimidazolesuccinocarboxamide synthase [Candidatus Eisenbacteria bacterium]|nr:phosphoribosylaminoimidazolesuccinocarboxamide synthase [Candidatus Eisenbacteria bacterium]